MDSRNLDPEYSKFRKAVLKRDKHKCQMPGCGKKGKMEVHHILPYSKCFHLRTEPSNGITLCKKCHKSIKNKETFYGSIFINIINQNNAKQKTKNNKRHS